MFRKYKIKRFSLPMNQYSTNDIVEKLEKIGYYDYETSSKISKDEISINTDLNNPEIYLPLDNDYAQYGIEDFIRKMIPFASTNTKLDRDIYIQRIKTKLTKDQYIKIIKYIIDNEGYVVIYDKDL